MASADRTTSVAERPLTLAESVTLAVICERATHGWEVGTALSAEGDIGQVWSLSRSLTYRAIDQLVEQGLVRRSPSGPARGRQRQILRASAKGIRARDAWLSSPVEHLRDVRTELLVKLALGERLGVSGAGLLHAQRDAFGEHIDALTMGDVPDDVVSLWRRESARAVRRFLAEALLLVSPGSGVPASSAVTTQSSAAGTETRPTMASGPQPRRVRLSARNQLDATIVGVSLGDVMATVTAELPGGQRVVSAITKSAVDDLDLATGDEVIVIVKSTEIIIAKP